jgi:UDP-2,3-diacylglucosamine pyrophosphatase LpxH
MTRLPLRIFSDLHLGHEASRIDGVEKLRPLFRGAGTVIFNGDTWEELSPPWRQKSEEMLGQLRGILAEEGCDAVFLPGNHDPGWEGSGFMALAEGRIVITHGDALLRDGAPWKREMLAHPDVIDELWSLYPDAATDISRRLELARAIARRLPTTHPPNGRSLLSRALDAAFPPQRAIHMLSAWLRQGAHGARFCETYFPQAALLVVGHFHCRGIRRSRGKTVINTGSFVVPGPAGWVEWDGVSLSAGRICEAGKTFAMERMSSERKLFRKD